MIEQWRTRLFLLNQIQKYRKKDLLEKLFLGTKKEFENSFTGLKLVEVEKVRKDWEIEMWRGRNFRD